jgi:hypothetical protein
MFGIRLSYATPSAFESQKDRALLGLSADSGRNVRFRGKVKPESTFLLRTVLRALGELVWNFDPWTCFQAHLDPVITVHPDKIFVEAFSGDQTVYGMVTLDRELFEVEGETLCGTSHISFTSWLCSALAEMRSSRSTWLHLDSAGLELSTVGAGGRFEKQVEVPDPWVRGYLQLQHAMTMPGTRLRVRPVDLLAAVRFLRFSKARTAPRALRFELEPGQDARIVLEPWEQVFPLRGAQHQSQRPRTVRTWGRQRLRLLEPVLPFAESVDIWLKGRALPSFYQANLKGLSLMIGLSGGLAEPWSAEDGPSYELLGPSYEVESSQREAALALLKDRYQLSRSQLEEALGLDKGAAQGLLADLCREGLALYQPDQHCYRFRPLFNQALDLDKVFPRNPRLEQARAFLQAGQVEVCSCLPRETRKLKRLPGEDGHSLREVILRDWCLAGKVADQDQVEVTLNDTDAIIFARCGCPHFQEHLMARGPCAHMLALRWAGLQDRQDLPTSLPAQEEQAE